IQVKAYDKRMKPPFYADHVGSLLRPPELADARKAKISDLKQVEDKAIRAAVAKQEAIGLESITDGEFRRDYWHLDFMKQLDGVGFSYLCDSKVRENFRAHGDDPAGLQFAYANAINAALENRPKGLSVTMHTCRGNFRSTWFAAGAYQDEVLDGMFSANVD